MADEFSTIVEPYQVLKEQGAQAHEVGAQAKEDGLPLLTIIHILRFLFGLSLAQAGSVMREVEGKPPLPRHETQPIASSNELHQVLEEELGFCGVGADEAAIQLLRDVLRFARDRYDHTIEASAREQDTTAMFSRLCWERAPGLATWFLYFLARQDLIESHSDQIGAFINTRKGDWLLDALEQFELSDEAPVDERSK